MKGQIVNLNRERWLALADLAMRPGVDAAEPADVLGRMAGAMQSATPSSSEPYAMATCLAFRWGCQAFAFAAPLDRQDLVAALQALAKAVRNLFVSNDPGPAAVSMPAPGETFDADEVHAWQRRADLAG
ncbi:hypothetical protein [Brevundimonas sp.]|uniref:hypothetical protein n=1 Tax=Brevundimonas sp. TaxID=1871086 RepID=UPI0026016C4A|nr:hypothetical protein [Brevundimonas sp.]